MKIYEIPAVVAGASLLLGVAAVLSLGCTSANRALPVASVRSGCPSDKIKVIKQDGHDLVLEVCGQYEDWRWNALNGWEYDKPSPEQPLSPPMDGHAHGVPDDPGARQGGGDVRGQGLEDTVPDVTARDGS